MDWGVKALSITQEKNQSSESCPIITTKQKHKWGNESLNIYKETPAKRKTL
jgi:hypothetical protein